MEDLIKLKNSLNYQKNQIVLFNLNGDILDSCNTIFNAKKTYTNLVENLPLFESLIPIFKNMKIGENLEMDCVEMQLNGEEKIFNFILTHQSQNVFVWLIYDHTRHYLYMKNIKNERNITYINNEYLEIENRSILAEKKLLDFQNQELERSIKFKTDFFAKITHEIRTPLHGISGLTELLLAEFNSTFVHDNLINIQATANHLNAIVNDILDFSKIVSGNLILKPTWQEFPTFLNPILKTFESICNNINIEFIENLPETFQTKYLFDSTRLSQILYNILGNACKFTSKGSILFEISTENIDNQFDNIKFTIKDTGIGMNEFQKSNLFKPYVQNHQNYEGTGLGLNITQQIINIMNGKIVIESESNVGTTVIVELVLKKNVENQIDTNFKSKKILVIEDNKINQTIIEMLLNSLQIEVKITSSGEAALKILENESFDVIFTDINLSGMNGYEIANQIKNKLKLNIPIIAITAEDHINQDSLFSNVIYKPFEKKQLKSILENIFK